MASKHTATRNAGCYDVIIIGGGPAGATTAITLAQKFFHPQPSSRCFKGRLTENFAAP